MWSSETWTNPLLSPAGGLTPGQTLQPNDLSSAMETSTNPVAFVSAQKKMPQINLALCIHLLLRLKTSSKLAKRQGAHGASCKNFGSWVKPNTAKTWHVDCCSEVCVSCEFRQSVIPGIYGALRCTSVCTLRLWSLLLSLSSTTPGLPRTYEIIVPQPPHYLAGDFKRSSARSRFTPSVAGDDSREPSGRWHARVGGGVRAGDAPLGPEANVHTPSGMQMLNVASGFRQLVMCRS